MRYQLPKGTGGSFDNIKSRIGLINSLEKLRKAFLSKTNDFILHVISDTIKLDI